jgi:hypothetical protein
VHSVEDAHVVFTKNGLLNYRCAPRQGEIKIIKRSGLAETSPMKNVIPPVEAERKYGINAK